MAFREIENLMTVKESADKTRMFRILLNIHILRRRLDAEDSELPGNYLIELTLSDIGLEYIPR
jgi:hypothetical protein